MVILFTKSWQDSFIDGLVTVLVAKDIAGNFDRVWHEGFL